jgi:hypothetical protein
VNRFRRHLFLGLEIVILSALVLTTRCANYHDVFVGPNIYFTDADCYARMIRVRLCSQHPGLIVRHHSFENFPEGTTPHTTAPFDYLILALSAILKPFTPRSIDLAGAYISPLLALLAAGFLCWWSRYMKLRFGWTMLTLFAVSPILVHGTALGRPDHQSLLILLVIVGVCADWILLTSSSTGWSIVSGLAWAFAIWVSAYEPLLLFLLGAAATIAVRYRYSPAIDPPVPPFRRLTNAFCEVFVARQRRIGWYAFAVVVGLAMLIERRVPPVLVFVRDPLFRNWSRTVGELASIPLLNPIWFNWLGWLIIVVPVLLLLLAWRRNGISRIPLPVVLLLGVTLCLTMWQARWGYFFASLFVISLPVLLGSISQRFVAWSIFVASLWPILGEWDRMIWPDEAAAARQLEQRHEVVELRELSLNMISAEQRPCLAPWWLSPSIAYWSGQPGVAGSSHESLPGIADSAHFFLTNDAVAAAEILKRRRVRWVISYDGERVEINSAMILGRPASNGSFARLLDYRPAQSPAFLRLSSQNGTAKIFEVVSKW